MIIHPESHTDHAITPEQWQHIMLQFRDRSAFFIETIELPEELGHVMNGLYGPSCGDAPVPETEAYYARRGDRAWNSRMTRMPARPTRFVRVIAGPHEETCTECLGAGTVRGSLYSPDEESRCGTCNGDRVIKYDCILYTAYGVSSKDMPAAPKEPGDIRKQLEELEVKRRELRRAQEIEFFKTFPEGVDSPGAEAMLDAHDAARHAQYLELVKLREKRAEADAYWATHALATEAP